MEYKGKIESIKCCNSPKVTSTLPASDGTPLTGGAQVRLPKLVLPTFKRCNMMDVLLGLVQVSNA